MYRGFEQFDEDETWYHLFMLLVLGTHLTSVGS